MAFDFDIPTQKNNNKCLLTQKVPLFMTKFPQNFHLQPHLIKIESALQKISDFLEQSMCNWWVING